MGTTARRRRGPVGAAVLVAAVVVALVVGPELTAATPATRAGAGVAAASASSDGAVRSLWELLTAELDGTASADLPPSLLAQPPASVTESAPVATAAPVVVPSGPAGEPGVVTAAMGTAPGIGPVVLDAYGRAVARSVALYPSCHLSWWLLAAIGQVESGNAWGRTVAADGSTSPRILGVALDGRPGVALIRDSDAGRWDGDTTYDRAVGPLQFIPSTWRSSGRDGNGDGIADPHNVYDAATSAAGYLCGYGRDLTQPSDLRAAVLAYNHSDRYLVAVLRWATVFSASPTPATAGAVRALAVQVAATGAVSASAAPSPAASASGSASVSASASPTASPSPAELVATPTAGPPVVAPVVTPVVTPVPSPSATATLAGGTTGATTSACPTADPTADPTAAAGTASPSAGSSPTLSPSPSATASATASADPSTLLCPPPCLTATPSSTASPSETAGATTSTTASTTASAAVSPTATTSPTATPTDPAATCAPSDSIAASPSASSSTSTVSATPSQAPSPTSS